MYDDNITADWMTGFAKAAADAGLSPEDTQALLLTTQRMTLATKQSDDYAEAYDHKMREAGLEKDAQGFWQSVGGGAAGGAALGLVGSPLGSLIGAGVGGLGGAATYLLRGGKGGRERRELMAGRKNTLNEARKFQQGQQGDFDYQQQLKSIRESSPYTQQRLAKESPKPSWHGGSFPSAPPRRYYSPRQYAY